MKGRTLLASQDAFNFVALEVSVHAWQGVNRCYVDFKHSCCINIKSLRHLTFGIPRGCLNVLKFLV